MSQKLWGGRFASDITESVLRYTETVSVDTRMLEHDLWQNIVHVLMLGEQGINDPDVTRAIIEGLLELADECANGRLELDVQFEDVTSQYRADVDLENRCRRRRADAHCPFAQRPSPDRCAHGES